MGILTLLTDFGLSDPFVGVMKGVILSRAPNLQLVDLSHGIPPQDVVAAAFWLERSAVWFPPGTVHVAVVDPGVGSERAALAVAARGQLFVAPDNGLLGPILASDPTARLVRVEPARLRLSVPSRTFHGRDVFGPVGAELARGVELERVGSPVTAVAPSVLPASFRDLDGARGVVVVVDHFGNLISNIRVWTSATELEVAGQRLPIRGTFSDVPENELVAYAGSFGTYEVAVRNGSARDLLGVAGGAEVRVREANR